MCCCRKFEFICTLHLHNPSAQPKQLSNSFETILSSTFTKITPRRLIKLARKWQKLAAAQRRRVSFPKKSSFVTSKGHFVVYTTDEKRFMVPLELLSKNVFVELFRLSEEEFGLPTDGPITLPCDSAFLEYIVQLARGCVADELEKALLTSLTCHASASNFSSLQQNHQQMLICGF